MAFVPLTNGALFVLDFHSSTASFSNGIHATKPAWVEEDAEEIGTNIALAYEGQDTIPLHEYFIFGGVTVYDQRSSGAPVYLYPVTGDNGDYSGDLADPCSAFVVTFRTTHRGRAGRGRWFWGGLAESMMSGQEVLATPAVQITAWATLVVAVLTAAGWTPVIKSCQQDGVPVSPANAWPITTVEYRSRLVGHQRSRSTRP